MASARHRQLFAIALPLVVASCQRAQETATSPAVPSVAPADVSRPTPRPTLKTKPEALPPAADSPERWRNSLGMEFRRIPRGAFAMEVPDPDGPPPGPLVRRWRPKNGASTIVKSVTLSKDFEIGVLEVTLAQFQNVVGRDPSGDARNSRVTRFADRPAASVSWQEAEEFCAKLSERPEEKAAGRRYRLPTEAEWERARQTIGKPFSWFGTSRGPLHWQVMEICANWFELESYRTMPEIDPMGPPAGTSRVARTSWSNPDPFVRVFTFRVVAAR